MTVLIIMAIIVIVSLAIIAADLIAYVINQCHFWEEWGDHNHRNDR